MEMWGTLQSLCTKSAVRIVNKIGYLEHTNSLFLNSKMWKFTDLDKFKTGQIIFRRRNNVLPKILNVKSVHRQRGELHFKKHKARTTTRSVRLTVCGVVLFSNVEEATQI